MGTNERPRAEGDFEAVNAGATDLDPGDWPAFRRLAHAMLDDMIDHVRTLRERPVWQPAPAAAEAHFQQPLPRQGRELGAVLDEVKEHILPFGVGNAHPRFMGWVHGAGTPVGMVAELVAAGLDLNCGGRNHIAHQVERQIAAWMAAALGWPAGASGLFVTGSSMANLLAVVVARVAALGSDSRAQGLRPSGKQLVAYCSQEAHSCIAKAMEVIGIGSANLRRVACDDMFRLDAEALERRIDEDLALGLLPFLVVATAGTVNTGAVDPIAAVGEIARRKGLWLHVDGAIGAMLALSPELRGRLAGIEAAQSIAMDFHKWGHVPYDAGFLLVRDGAAHKRAFAGQAAYLERSACGLAAGDTWPCDLGVDLSRGFRALKTWMTLVTLGTDKIGQSVAANCKLAAYLATLVEASPWFEIKAPVALNIVCFGIVGEGNGSRNRDIVMDVQMSGEAAPSWTTIEGESVIRCAIVNHRTTRGDVDAVFAALERCAAARSGQNAAGTPAGPARRTAPAV